MHKIEIFNAENNTSNTIRVRYYKSKIKELGAIEKTYKIPFQHRLRVSQRKRNEKKEKKQDRKARGIYNKKYKK